MASDAKWPSVSINLAKRNMPIDTVCPLCNESDETILHVFRTCHFTRLFWALSDIPSAALYGYNGTDI